MKKLFSIKKMFIACSATVLLATSCSDEFLEKELIGINAQTGSLDNPDNIRLAVNSAYAHVNGGDWWTTNFPRLLKEASTDDAWGGNDYQDRPGELGMADFSNVISTNGFVDGLYFNLNNGIRSCNWVITSLENSKVISDQLRDRYIGEMKYLRAYFYNELTTTYGDAVLNISASPTDGGTFPKRVPVSEIYKQMVKDLEEAAAVLPEKGTYQAQDVGRVTKGAALALLSRVALYNEDYPKAESSAASVINSGKYTLESRFSKIFEPENVDGPESIFEINYTNAVGFGNGPLLSVITTAASVDGGWGWFGLTSNLENAYKAENDDVRRKATIIKAGEVVDNEEPERIYPFHKVGGKPAHTSWRYHRKYYVPSSKRVGTPWSFNNIKQRLGEVYLNHAEASAFNGKADQALNSLNKVRNRVGLPNKSGLSGDALKQAIWIERRLELAGEGTFRWEDLRRIKVGGKKLIYSVLGPNGSFVNYNLKDNRDSIETLPHREALNKGAFFKEGVHDVWPIPQNAILANKALQQNPGYN